MAPALGAAIQLVISMTLIPSSGFTVAIMAGRRLGPRKMAAPGSEF
jgi:hypothetical protein